MLRALFQFLLVLGFVAGAALFFGGFFIAVPPFALLVMFPSIEWIINGHFTQPDDYLAMTSLMGIGFALAGGGTLLIGSCFNCMELRARQTTLSLIFGSATLFFLWVMFAFDTAPQYKMFMAALVAICGLVALFGPIVLAKEERA